MSTDLRITGLASGMDTESMIEKLMEVERVRVDKVQQDKQLVVWRQEIYNDLNKDFANFIINSRKDFGLTQVTSTGAFIPSSYKNLDWVKKTVSSDESIATVSSTSDAFDGTYNVKVHNLAEGVSLVSKSAIGGTSNANLADQFGFGAGKKIEFEINGKKFVLGGLDENADGNIDKDLNEISLDDVAKLINATEGIGVKASYDKGIDRFFLQTTGTGKEAYIQIDSTDIEGVQFINKLNLGGTLRNEAGDIINEEGSLIGKKLHGRDAKIDFNGAENIEFSSNNITINGITMNLTGEGDFAVTVATDVDAVYEKVEAFITKYNELVDKTSELLGQKRYYDYAPLTEAQKKDMEEKEIELWEEKAKSGLLKNDDIISRTMQSIRSSLYEKFDGPFSLITEIGISTEKFSRGTAGGKLEIDEKKLKEKIAENPEAIIEMLFKESTPRTETESGNTGGLVTRVYDNLMQGMEDIIEKSGTGDNSNLYRDVKSNILMDFVTTLGSRSLLDKNIADFDTRIDELNDALIDKENYYYNKFAAMETYVNRMNSQSMWLAQQFSM